MIVGVLAISVIFVCLLIVIAFSPIDYGHKVEQLQHEKSIMCREVFSDGFSYYDEKKYLLTNFEIVNESVKDKDSIKTFHVSYCDEFNNKDAK